MSIMGNSQQVLIAPWQAPLLALRFPKKKTL